jgi:hypothetical protein
MSETVKINGREFPVVQHQDPTSGPWRPKDVPKKPGKSKYRNKPTIGVDGKRKASRVEAKRDGELALLERGGKIVELKRQPRFPLVVNDTKICTYVGDWQYIELWPDGRMRRKVVEDKKGYATREFKIKWALARALYPNITWRLS